MRRPGVFPADYGLSRVDKDMIKNEVLDRLKKSSGYISGQELSDELKVSRTAVWKAIQSLVEEGYQIEGVRNRGYRLISSPDILTKERLLREEYVPWPGAGLYVYEETDSSNIRAQKLGEQGAPDGTLVVAEKQTAGKGRRGRVWQSPKGDGLYYSILLYPPIAPGDASLLTLVSAYSVSRALDTFAGVQTKIKWPNDVIFNKKKIVGILTEMRVEDDYIGQVVIGCGLNVHNTSFPEELSDKATSLFLETGEKFDRAQMLGRIMKAFYEDYHAVIKAGDLTPIMDDYNARLVNKDAKVRILDPKGAYDAVAKGINERGELLVIRDDGITEKVYAGEVSVRGIYGYV